MAEDEDSGGTSSESGMLKKRNVVDYGRGFTSSHGDYEQSQFKLGIKKMCTTNIPDLKLDEKARVCIAENLLNFCKLMAERTTDRYEDETVLEPVHLYSVLEDFFDPEVFDAATSEGNKHLALYESGVVEFYPQSTRARSGWSSDTINTSNRIYNNVFKDGINSYLSKLNPPASIDPAGAKKVSKVLMTIARYEANQTTSNCKRGKLKTMRDIDIRQAVRETFPEVLQQHALIQGTRGIDNFKRGTLPFKPKETSTPNDKEQNKRKRGVEKQPGRPAKKTNKSSGKKDSPKGKGAAKRKATPQAKQPSAKRTKKSPATRGTSKSKTGRRVVGSRESLEKGRSGKKVGRAPKAAKGAGKTATTSGKGKSSAKASSKRGKSSSGKATPSKKAKSSKRAASSNKGKSSKRESPSAKKKAAKGKKSIDEKESPPSLLQMLALSSGKDKPQQKTLLSPSDEDLREGIEKLNFKPALTDLVPAVFPKEKIQLSEEVSDEVNSILQNVCTDLIKRGATNADKKETLDVEHVKKAVAELFPGETSKHAIAFGINTVAVQYGVDLQKE